MIKIIFLGLAVTLMFCACNNSKSDDSDLVPTFEEVVTSSSIAGSGGAFDCMNGEKRLCHIILGSHENVLSCYVGIQECVNGTWSVCESKN